MNLDVIEGYVEVEGLNPILVTALHGFGTDRYKRLVDILKKEKPESESFKDIALYHSAVDMYTWEIAYKAAIAERCWLILPTMSKVDKPENLDVPDYNLNKVYASKTPMWHRVRDLISDGVIEAIIDIHGMKNVGKWPDVCVSTCNYTSVSKSLVDDVVNYLKSKGLGVTVDYPFSGGSFIRSFGKPPKVEALALEYKRNLRFFGSQVPIITRGVIRVVKEHLNFKRKI